MAKNAFKKAMLSVACLAGSNLMLMASLNVDITFVDPSDTIFTATLSGSATMNSSPLLDEWDFDSSERGGWRTLNRDSGVNLLDGSRDSFLNNTVSNSTARALVGSDFVTVTHVDFFSRTFDNPNDFGFNFDSNPNFSSGDTFLMIEESKHG